MNRTFQILAFVLSYLAVSSCGSDTLHLDYSNQDFPAESVKSKYLDSLILIDNKIQSLQESSGVSCSTDKTKYKKGETIVLTIANNSDKETEYFYPNPAKPPRISHPSKTDFEEQLLSTTEAIFGNVQYSTPDYVYLLFEGAAAKEAEKFGYKPFKRPLAPNQKLQFNVTIPERAGTYRFIVSCFSHNEEDIGLFGINKYLYSNAFEVIN